MADRQFQQVKDFHALMDGRVEERPRCYPFQEACHRAGFKVEELVEFLHAASADAAAFEAAIDSLHQAVDTAKAKVSRKASPSVSLTGQVDALLDLLYFTYGSFVLMGVDPEPLFEIVHRANMGKIFPDGRAHFDPVTHKIAKPDDWEERFAPEPALARELAKQGGQSKGD